MSNVRILNDNFLAELAATDFSSEQAAFPAENIYDTRRSKVWRSEGYWEILAPDNTIVFRETAGGPDLTATIPPAEYSSSTAFFAAVKAALEAVGDSTYTVSADTTTGKVKIVSNGSGGGGVLILKWTVSTAMAAILGYSSAADDSGLLTYLADTLKIHTSEWLEWDLGLEGNPRALVLIGLRNRPISISPTAVITIQGNTTNTWTTPQFEQVVTYDERAISLFNEDGFHTVPLRYWRLVIEDASNPLGFVELGFAFLGDYAETERGCVGFPFQTNDIDNSKVVISEGGFKWADKRQKSKSFSLEWNGLTPADNEMLESVFDEHGLSVPLFFVFDPNQAFSTNYGYYIRYVRFEETPSYELLSPANFSASMALAEEL